MFGQPTAALLEVPLLILPRLAIVLAAARAIWLRRRRRTGPTCSRCSLCRLRRAVSAADAGPGRRRTLRPGCHARPAPVRGLVPRRPADLAASARWPDHVGCLLVGLDRNRSIRIARVRRDRARRRVAWVQPRPTRRTDLRRPDVPPLHGDNPLLVYYLADRAPASATPCSTPASPIPTGARRGWSGIWTHMTPYLVLDRDGRRQRAVQRQPVPGSHPRTYSRPTTTVCDLGSLVIQAGTASSGRAACPAVALRLGPVAAETAPLASLRRASLRDDQAVHRCRPARRHECHVPPVEDRLPAARAVDDAVVVVPDRRPGRARSASRRRRAGRAGRTRTRSPTAGGRTGGPRARDRSRTAAVTPGGARSASPTGAPVAGSTGRQIGSGATPAR